MSFTAQDITSIITNATTIIRDSIEKAKTSNASQVIKDQINQNANEIQSLINSILNSAGAVTTDQINQLDYKVRMQKFKILELSSEKTKRKYIIIGVSIVVVLGTLFYLTRKKQ